MNIKKLRALRYVRRFNFHNCNRHTTVAEHSFFVALITMELADDLGMESGSRCIREALLHDAEEAVTGDIGYLTRREISNLGEIEAKARVELGVETVAHPFRVVMLADCIELKMYLEEERRSGNMGLVDIERETYGRILKDMATFPKEIREKWLGQLEDIGSKEMPSFMTHEGE